MLLYFTRRRQFSGWAHAVILMFGAFIIGCGTTHLMAIWDLWHSTYRLEGLIKAITAVLSVGTAIVFGKLLPLSNNVALADDVERVNASLRAEVEARREAENKLLHVLEAERLASEAKLRTYFEAAPQGIVAVASHGRIALVNRWIEQMFGYDRAELLGKPLELLVPERLRAAYLAGRDSFFAEPSVRTLSADVGIIGLR